jgi:hypothetical protein
VPPMMRDSGGSLCLVVVCDHCGGVIADDRDGNCQWKMGLKDTGVVSLVFFTCRHCCHPFEQAHTEEGFLWGAIELVCFPLDLGASLCVDRAAAW